MGFWEPGQGRQLPTRHWCHGVYVGGVREAWGGGVSVFGLAFCGMVVGVRGLLDGNAIDTHLPENAH